MSKTEQVSEASLTFTSENVAERHGDAIYRWSLQEKEKSDDFSDKSLKEEQMMCIVKIARYARVYQDKAVTYDQIEKAQKEQKESVIQAQKMLEDMAREDGFDVERIKSKKKSKNKSDSGLDEDVEEDMESAREKLKKLGIDLDS